MTSINHKIIAYLSFILFILPCTPALIADDNLIIDKLIETTRLIPNKEHTNFTEMKHNRKLHYIAKKFDAKASTYIPYSLYSRIDKISAPKVEKKYGPMYGNGIFYSDDKACIASFPVTVKNGALLEVETTHTDPDFFKGDLIYETEPINSAELTYIFPADMRARFTYEVLHDHGRLKDVKESINGKDCHVTFTFDTIAAVKDEPFSAPAHHWMPAIVWRGLYPDPNAVYRHLSSYTTEPDPKPEVITELASRITQGCTSDKAKIEAITDWVHKNIRYVAVEYGELGRKPAAPSEVADSRFGDCKGSANLIKALLKASGIDGRLVWIATERYPYAWDELPSPASGNHMIAAALTGDSILFIDGTASHTPAGSFPVGIQGQQGMIENGDECILQRVPSPSAADNSLTSTNIAYSIDGDELVADFKSICRGNSVAKTKAYLESVAADRRSHLLSLIALDGRKGIQAISPQWVENDPLSGELTASFRGQGSLKKVGQKLRLSLQPAVALERYIFDTRDRKQPMFFPEREKQSTTVTLAIPEGFTVEKLPESRRVENQWFNGDVTFSMADDGKMVKCDLNWMITERLVDAQRVKEVVNDIRTLARGANATITLAPAS